MIKKKRFDKTILITFLFIILFPLINADLTATNPDISYEGNKVVGEHESFKTKLTNNILCSYMYCPFGLEIFTQDKQCIPLEKINFQSSKYGNLGLQFHIDSSWNQDGEIYECDCAFGCPDEQWKFDTMFDEDPPIWYDEKKDYCFNTTRIYKQDYIDYQNGLICVDNYKKLQGHFVAPEGSSGKFDYLIELTINFVKKLIKIDPTWITTNGTFNGTHNYTEMGVTGELQINNTALQNGTNLTTYNDTIDVGAVADWKNFTCVQESMYNLAELPNWGGSDPSYINAPKNISTGTILLMHLNNDSSVGENSTLAYDYSPGQNNGTLVNTAAWNTTSKKLGDASILFDGDSDYITIGAGLDTAFSTKSFSISSWMKTSDVSGFILSNRGTGDDEVRFYVSGTGPMKAIYYDAPVGVTATSTTSVNTSAWVHVVTTCNTNDLKLYINGVQEGGTQDVSGSGNLVLDNDIVFIGVRADNDGTPQGGGAVSYFDGNIDELAIWNRSLSGAEVEDLFLRGAGHFNVTVGNDTFNNCSSQNLTLANSQTINVSFNLWRDTISPLSPEFWNYTIGYESAAPPPPPFGTCVGEDCYSFDDRFLPVFRAEEETFIAGSNVSINVNNSDHLEGRNTEELFNYFEGLYDAIYVRISNFSSYLINVVFENETFLNDTYVNVEGDEITGDLNVTGNFTGNNYYAEAWAKDSAISNVVSQSVYVNITNMTNSKVNGFDYDGNGTFVSLIDGLLSVNSQFAFSGNANQEYHLRFVVNGVGADNCHTRRVIGTGGDVGSASITCLCPVSIGDMINVQIENVDSTGSPSIADVNLNLVRIGN